MQKYSLLFGSFILFCSLSYAEPKDTELKKVLEIINSINHYSQVYTGTIQIANFTPDKEPVISVYDLYAKGLDNSLLITRKPAKDENKMILLKENKLWFYFPKIKKVILMNPANTLSGAVSIGDIITPPLLDIYEYESSAEKDADGKKILEIVFKAKDKNAPYGKVIYHFADDRIIYSESYSRSGILLKQAYFSEFIRSLDGFMYATQIKLVNSTNPRYYSLIKISNLTAVDSIRDYYLLPEGLEKIK